MVGGFRGRLLQLGDGHVGRRQVGIAEPEVDHVLAGAPQLQSQLPICANTYGGSRSSRRNRITPAKARRDAEAADWRRFGRCLPPRDIVDEYGDRAAVCELQLRQYGGVAAFAGEISTVRCHEDNVLFKQRVSEPGHGRVLVVDGGGSLRVALAGDCRRRSRSRQRLGGARDQRRRP